MKSKAIEKLKSLNLEAKRKKYSQFPNYDLSILTPYQYKQNSANAITRCIIDYIKYLGGQAERISTTGRYIDESKIVTDVVGITKRIGSGRWVPGTGRKGSADISATINGKSVKIEVKYGKDKQSEYQKDYQYEIERAGGVYLIARNFDQIKPVIDELFEI